MLRKVSRFWEPEAWEPMNLSYSLTVACRFIVGAILLFGAVGKISHLRDFRKILNAYRILPSVATPLMFVLLVALEFASGFGALVPKAAPSAALIGACLLLLFGLSVAVNLVRGRRELACGCFGKASKTIS